MQLSLWTAARADIVYFVTPYDGEKLRSNAGANCPSAHELSSLNAITIADWAQIAQDNPDIWAGTDYVHPETRNSNSINRGGTLYAQMVKDAVDKTNQNTAKP